MRVMTLMLLANAANLLIANIDVLSTMDFRAIATSPLILIGLADLLIALLLFLEVTQIYSFIRMRAVLGAGFFAVYFLSSREYLALAAVLAGLGCLYAGTVVSKLWSVIALGVFGLAGMGGFAYFMLM